MRAAARCADALAISISLSAVSDFSDLLLRSCLVPAASLVLDTLIPLPSRANAKRDGAILLDLGLAFPPRVCPSCVYPPRRLRVRLRLRPSPPYHHAAEGRLLMLLRTGTKGLLRVPLAISSSCDVCNV